MGFKTTFFALVLLFKVWCLSSASNAMYNVQSFGAKSDGKSDSTKAFLSAWSAACTSTGPAKIYVPPGRFLIGSALFGGQSCKSSSITIRIDGTLVAPYNFNIIGHSGNWIKFERVTGISVYGGTLDGQGTSLWACKNSGNNCPQGAADLNPKISDFGTAKIFGDDESCANTNRIVGTYGYMAPEYAIDGIFSMKSDAFSFGVMMLEIISGKKNTGFYNSDRHINLLGYVWDLWNEQRFLEITDPNLAETISKREVVRYVKVALLCVQENATDRPNMSDVVSMLQNETISLPAPKQPSFTAILSVTNAELCRNMQLTTVNMVTISDVKGR